MCLCPITLFLTESYTRAGTFYRVPTGDKVLSINNSKNTGILLLKNRRIA